MDEKFSNGTIIKHDRNSGNVEVSAVGEVLIKSPSKVTIDCPATETTGDLMVKGALTYMKGMTGYGGGGATAMINGSLETKGGDIKADNISLKLTNILSKATVKILVLRNNSLKRFKINFPCCPVISGL